jgi:DNA-directed RNA polymerase subunit RPC12/RpoP
MRYTDTKKMICKYCMDHKQNVAKGNMSVPDHKKPIRALVEEDGPQEASVSYVCTACKYSFKRKKSVPVTSCPYCGKSGKIELKSATSASSIIKDSMDKRFEF